MRASRRKFIVEFLEKDPPTSEDLELLHQLRPKTRADCKDGIRPCPFVGCRYHLYMEIGTGKSRTILPNFTEEDPTNIPQTCALDVADTNMPNTLDAIGKLLNLTRERVRQIERRFLAKLNIEAKDLRDFLKTEHQKDLTTVDRLL